MQTDKGHTPERKRNATEADVKSVDGTSSRGLESSHNDKSHEKAGGETGAGGGKKQERHQKH